MITIAKGKSVRVTAEPEENEDEKKTIDLVNKMKAELHELNKKDEEDKEEGD